MIVKFNGGNLALLCNECHVIIGTGKDIDLWVKSGTMPEINTAEFTDGYCFCSNECKNKYLKNIESKCVVLKK